MPLEYSLVKRAVRASVIDGRDDDDTPDVVNVNGTVTFTPVMSGGDAVQVTVPGGMETLVLSPIECPINDGIISHRGRDGVKLAAGGEGCNPPVIRWKATFSHMQAGGWSFNLKPVMFDAVPDGEVDLTLVSPIAGASEPIVRGPAGVGLKSITVDGSELVVTVTSEAGTYVLSRIPLEDVVRAEADQAVASAQAAIKADVDAAAASASSAQASAATASTQAETAATQAGAATDQASAAAMSAENAKTSETNAKTSETNAKQSETNAAASEQAAATSASNAATSETNAQDSAAAAAGSATEAAAHADRAEKAADPTELRDEITQQLADLVDGAPEDLDTIREVAEYAQANRGITDQLNAAIGNKANKTHTHTTEQVTGLDTALADKVSTQALADGLAGKADVAVVNARPALFSGAGAPPSTIPNARVGDWWLNTTTMELSKITGV